MSEIQDNCRTPKQILFSSGREASYIRNALVLAALCKTSNVVDCTSDARFGPLRVALVLLKLMLACADIGWIGFWGHPLMLLPGPFRRKPTIFDAYISVFNTLCEDRRWFGAASFPGRLAHWLDRRACENATLVIVDTIAHGLYFAETLRVPPQKIRVLYVGCDEKLFSPRPAIESNGSVFTYGSFQPLHGMEIIAAAATASGSRATFTIGGGGENVARFRKRFPAVNFIDWIPFYDLPDRIAQAEICLGGPFGQTRKALMVVPTKTYQFMAMGKPIVATNTPANREVLINEYSALLISPGDPNALAEAVYRLLRDHSLRARLGKHARQEFLRHYTNAHREAQVRALLSEVT